MKILSIGQLPKEIGGNYTTGAANVVYELSKYSTSEVQLFTFGTNIKKAAAINASRYTNQYIGYRFSILKVISQIILHPILFFKEILHYVRIDHENPLRLLFYKQNIANAIKEVSPDLIHVHSISNVSSVYYARGTKNIPILLTCHGIFYRGNTKDVVMKDKFLGNIKLVDYYTGLTNESLAEYKNILGIPNEKVTIIPNGVDCSKFFYSDRERQRIRKELGVLDTTFVFITVASVQKRKGQFAFIDILNQLSIDYQYWIIGTGTDIPKIEEYCQKHQITDRIKLLGYCHSDELYKYYSAADIYAHTSTKEGQALSELEASATGLRVIVNEKIKGTIANDISSKKYYILNFENLNKDELLDWIMNYQKNNRISEKKFDWSIIARMYADIYNKLISKDLCM